MTNKEPSPGPYKSTTTKVIKITPIEFTVTTTIDSTHVPPPDCGCGGGTDILSILQAAASQLGAQVGPPPAPVNDPSDSPIS
jgi:hypothetical protein